MSSKEKFQEILKNLSEFDKEKIYRMVWYDHVCEDVGNEAANSDIKLTEQQIRNIAYRYVYDGDYNLTLNYYQNLHNLIDKELRS